MPENGHGGLSSRTSALRQLGCARVVPTLDNLSLFLGSWLEAPLPDWVSESALLSTAFSNQTLRFSAEVLPRLATSSYSTVCPSLSVERPAFSTAEICTNTSLPPLLGWINPKPLVGLNHFTVPLAITSSPRDQKNKTDRRSPQTGISDNHRIRGM